MSNTSLRMVYDIRYRNGVVRGCMWYKQNVPRRGSATPHLGTREDKFFALQCINRAVRWR